MADEDKSQKTEDPTQKRLEEAHRKGQVAKSQELVHWFMLSGGALALLLFSGVSARDLAVLLLPYLDQPHRIPTDPGALLQQFEGLGWQLCGLLLLPIGLMIVAAIAGNMVQHRPVASAERLKPELSKISPAKGLKKLFGKQSLVDLAKALFKIAIVAGITGMVLWPRLQDVELYVALDPAAILPLVLDLTLAILIGVVAVLAVIAGLDVLYQRWEFFEGQKMSKQEIKEEHKQAEGDPHIKARIRQIRMDRARKRMMAKVPSASVVITNPTHYAVALRYEAGETTAPVLVAKGQDLVALKIREIAEASGVPIVENPPLARALNASVELDQEIPPEFYRAVAEVIGYVMRLRDRAGGRRTR